MLYSDWLFGWVSEEMTLQHKTIIQSQLQYSEFTDTCTVQLHTSDCPKSNGHA